MFFVWIQCKVLALHLMNDIKIWWYFVYFKLFMLEMSVEAQPITTLCFNFLLFIYGTCIITERLRWSS